MPERLLDLWNWYTKILTVAALLAFVASCGAIWVGLVIIGNQGDAAERGFKTRAQACRLQHAHGLRLTDECLESEVTRYYDPREVVPP